MGKAAETIMNCIKRKNMSQRQLAELMGEDVRVLNQQLNRQKDLKVERFIDVLEHIGYRLEIVDNDGIHKVSKEFAKQIYETVEPKGLFWFTDGNFVVGIDTSNGEVLEETFFDKEECFKWFRRERCITAEGIVLNE